MRERQRARMPAAAPPPARARQPLIPVRGGPDTLLPTAPAPALRRPEVAPPDEAPAPLPAPDAEPVTAEAGVAEPEADGAAAAGPALMEVNLLIPPPPPDLERRTMAGARSASRAMGGAGTATRALPPADANTAAARANVQEPAEETTARAQGALTAALREQPAPSPEIEQLCDDIQDAIENRRPPDEDSLRRTNPEAEAQAVGQALNDDITDESQGVATDYNAVNAPAAGTPAQNSAPLPDTPATVPTPAVNAAAATPPAVPAADVDLGADVAATQASVEEAGMTSAPAQLITTGPVAEARAGMGELEQAAAVAPGEVLRQQDEAIAASREAALQVESQALAALERSRSGTVQDTFTAQLAMAGSEEEQRVAAAAAAESIFTTAQTAVNNLLTPMVSTAMSMWNTGKDRIAGAFDAELQEAKRLVDERHEGVGGAIVSLWDSATGLPDYITDIYTRAERTFGHDICTLIREVSTYVNGIVIACEELIDNADRDIAALFAQLPESLQGWATEQQAGFQGRLDGLRDNVHETQQNFTNDLVSQAGDAVQEARERIDALREAAKGLIQKVADAVNAFIDDPVRAIINGLLMLVGIAPAAFWALLARIEQVASDIADDPQTFATNLLAALRLGFDKFFGNFFSHLLQGFINWLFSAMGTVGVQLPADTSLKSIITFFLQLMGLTWTNIRKILVKYVGERNVALLEKAYELLSVLISEGPGGIFELIKEKLDPNQIFNSIVEAAVHYMVETIAKQVATRILLLFNPVGAIAQAIEAIFRVLKWVFENAARIFQLVETVVNGMADLIAGNIEGMAKKTEQALAGMLVPVIDFIAGYLGMGDLPEKIAEVVGGFQQMVLAAVERAIAFMVDKAKALLERLGLGGGGGDLDDDEVGKEVRFSAAGESHRLWISTGAGVEVMVASTPGKLEVKIREWIAGINRVAEADRNEARQRLDAASSQLSITLTEAERANLAIQQAEAAPEDAEKQAEAGKQDDKAEAAEDALVPNLVRLFELFEETSLIALYGDELKQTDPVAQDEITKQVTEKEDSYASYKDPKNWPGFKGELLTGTGSVRSMYEAPLGTESLDKHWQNRNFNDIFLAGLNQAVPVASAQRATPPTEAQMFGPGTKAPDFARARRRTVHRREAPDGESGAVALAQPLKGELQRLLMAGGSISAAVGLAKAYFVETLKLSIAHQEYKIDPPPVPRLENSKLVIDYQYKSAADPAPKTFTVRVGLQDINGPKFEHSITGDNLVTKAAGTRGQLNVTTEEGGQVERGQERIRLERSHLIADWFQGTGYRTGLNIIHTSREFNQRNMKDVEIQLASTLRNWEEAYPGYFVNMRLRVKAIYEVLDHQQSANEVKKLLNDPKLNDKRDEIAQELFAILQRKQAPRMCENIFYDAEIYLGRDYLLEVIPTLQTGPDEYESEPL